MMWRRCARRLPGARSCPCGTGEREQSWAEPWTDGLREPNALVGAAPPGQRGVLAPGCGRRRVPAVSEGNARGSCYCTSSSQPDLPGGAASLEVVRTVRQRATAGPVRRPRARARGARAAPGVEVQ